MLGVSRGNCKCSLLEGASPCGVLFCRTNKGEGLRRCEFDI